MQNQLADQIQNKIQKQLDQCSICLTTLDQPLALQNCFHSFCKNCIEPWLDIKNNCPLCLNLVGQIQHNQLNKNNEQFDNGALQFQSQVNMIRDNLAYIEKRTAVKRAQSKNYKNHFPAYSLQYIQDQLLLVANYNDILTQSLLLNDRQNISFYLQLITEVLMDIEDVLNGGVPNRQQQYFFDQEQDKYCSSDEQQMYNEQKFKGKTLKKEKPRQKKSQMPQKNVDI